MQRRQIVFLINLLQDINIVRSLAYLSAREFDADILFLVSSKFLERDGQLLWSHELARINADVGGDIRLYTSAPDALTALQGQHGVIIAGSESSLGGHAETHTVFRIAPASFLKVTLQHGYECVGFLQSREHDVAHGRNVTFAADVLCGWCDAHSLTALTLSQRPKLYVTGPPTLLQGPKPGAEPPSSPCGLVCENLHSVRLRATGPFGQSYMETFFRFFAALGQSGLRATLRPHPGGQYVIKNKVSLPADIMLNNLPMYDIDLSSYAFGISSPSTVVLDMLLAGIPVGIWHDDAGIIDTGNYAGVTHVGALDDWIAFAIEATSAPEAILERQRQFLNTLAMPMEPDEIYRRYARLIAAGIDGPSVSMPVAGRTGAATAPP